MIDLHIHSTCSDGQDHVLEILKKAQKLKLDYISITDHCTCEANEIIKGINVNQYFKGKIIPGCEVTCLFRDQIIDVLAYGIDDSFQKWLDLYFSVEKFHEDQKKFLIKLKDVCKQMGLKFNQDLEITNVNHGADRIIYLELTKYEENKPFFEKEVWEHLGKFYRHCVCNMESPFYLDIRDTLPSLEETIAQIRRANGLSFLAHLYEYSFENKIEFLKAVVENKIDGVECYYSHFTEEQNKFLLNFCTERNLYISGGSDYHGSAKPDIKMGTGTGTLSIPKEVILPWVEF